jgi:hypothetical protein
MDNEYQPLIKNIVVTELTAGTQSVFTGKGFLHNIFVNSNTGGVFSLGNGTSSVLGNLQHSSITIGTGERELKFHGEVFETGLIINLTGTASLTVQYRKNA